jgi:formiminotetrahydrofolate cyclodeaminase
MPESLSLMTIAEVLDSMATGEPAPGGGSALALAGSFGAALVQMVASLTLGRERFAGVEQEIATARERAGDLRDRLAHLADEDIAAFTQVAAAYGLPKDTAEERAARRDAIRSAMRAAAGPPVGTAEACVEVLRLAELVATHGNRNASGDAFAAALLARAALLGARQNALANLAPLRDEAYAAEVRSRLDELAAAGEQAAARTSAAAGAGD